MKKITKKKVAKKKLVLVSLFIVLIAGLGAYRIYKTQLDAKAAYSWTDINSHSPYIRIYACKVDLGSKWKLQAKAKNTWTGSATRPYWSIMNADNTSSQLLGGYVSSNSTWTNIHYTSFNKSSVKRIQAYTSSGQSGGADDPYTISSDSLKAC